MVRPYCYRRWHTAHSGRRRGWYSLTMIGCCWDCIVHVGSWWRVVQDMLLWMNDTTQSRFHGRCGSAQPSSNSWDWSGSSDSSRGGWYASTKSIMKMREGFQKGIFEFEQAADFILQFLELKGKYCNNSRYYIECITFVPLVKIALYNSIRYISLWKKNDWICA